MNSIVKRPSFGFSPLDYLPTNLFTPAVMGEKELEDGTHQVFYNVAGFEKEDIKVSFDEKSHELSLSAAAKEANMSRSFNSTLILDPYTTSKDIKLSLKNGVLTVAITSVEKRKEEAITELKIE